MTVFPNEALSGSTAVSCWLSVFVYGSTDSRRDTTSQFAAIVSSRSALTMSLPGPQSTRSLPPNATWMKSLPARDLIVSGAEVPMIVSLRLVPRGAAAAAVDTQTRASTSGARRRIRPPSVPGVTRGLGRSTAKRALVEHPRAGAADGALELVRDARALHDDVRAHGAMPVGQTDEAVSSCHDLLNVIGRTPDGYDWMGDVQKLCGDRDTRRARVRRVRRDRADPSTVVGTGSLGAPVRRGHALARRLDDGRVGRRSPAADDGVPCAGRRGDQAVRRRQRQ